jgi:hypothetical protein
MRISTTLNIDVVVVSWYGSNNDRGADMIDVRCAAALVRRHPETVRRWVWSGRLAAQRQGNRLLMARGCRGVGNQRGEGCNEPR